MNLKTEHLDVSCSRPSFKDKDVIQRWKNEYQKKKSLFLYAYKYGGDLTEPLEETALTTQPVTSNFPAGLLAAADWIVKDEKEEGPPVLHRELLGDHVWVMVVYVSVKNIKPKAGDEMIWNKIMQPWNYMGKAKHIVTLEVLLKRQNYNWRTEHDMGFMTDACYEVIF